MRTEADLLKAADDAMYRANKVSRNKVIIYRASMPSDIIEGDLSSIFKASLESPPPTGPGNSED